MKKLLFTLLAILFFTSCEKDSITDLQSDQILEENDLDLLKKPRPKIDVCHKGKSFRVPENQLAKHTAHGDVQLIDEDGDGWVTLANECGIPVDCDDDDAGLTDNCCPDFIEVTMHVGDYNIDLETGTICMDFFPTFCGDEYELQWNWDFGRARMFWNEITTDVAFVSDRYFCELTCNNVGDYYFCTNVNDTNEACEFSIRNSDDIVFIFKTYEGNYWAVEWLSDDYNNRTTVTFRYRQLLNCE